MSLSPTARRLRRALAPLLIAIAVLAAAQPALAVTWYSRSAPLNVVEDGVVQGRAYGNFINYSGVSARQTSYQYDPRPGGQGVYVETDFYFYAPCGDGLAVAWCFSDEKSTTNTAENVWKYDYTAKYLQSDADHARAATKVCENHNLARDPCSPTVIRSFAY